MVNAAYETMHVSMGYDGIQRKAICHDGIELANTIINRCASMIA